MYPHYTGDEVENLRNPELKGLKPKNLQYAYKLLTISSLN